jgi:hypothetical protein
MEIEKQNEFLGELLTETIQELMVYRQLVNHLCVGAKITPDGLDSILSDLRFDDLVLGDMRDAWRTHLEAHVSVGGGFPRTVLLNFVQQWSPKDLRQMN